MTWRSPKFLVPVGIAVVLLIAIPTLIVFGRSSSASPTPAAQATPSIPSGSGPRSIKIVPENVTVTPIVITAVPTSANANLFTNPNAPAYVPGRGFTPDAQRVLDIVSLQTSLASYLTANKHYPPMLGDLFPAFAPHEGSTVLSAPPADPVTHQPYDYQVSADALSYKLSATLDSGKQYTGLSTDSP